MNYISPGKYYAQKLLKRSGSNQINHSGQQYPSSRENSSGAAQKAFVGSIGMGGDVEVQEFNKSISLEQIVDNNGYVQQQEYLNPNGTSTQVNNTSIHSASDKFKLSFSGNKNDNLNDTQYSQQYQVFGNENMPRCKYLYKLIPIAMNDKQNLDRKYDNLFHQIEQINKQFKSPGRKFTSPHDNSALKESHNMPLQAQGAGGGGHRGNSTQRTESYEKAQADANKWKQFGQVLTENFEQLKLENQRLTKEKQKDSKIINALMEQVKKLKQLNEVTLQEKNNYMKQASGGQSQQQHIEFDQIRREKENLEQQQMLQQRMIDSLNEKVKQQKATITQLSKDLSLQKELYEDLINKKHSNQHQELNYYKQQTKVQQKEVQNLAEEVITLRSMVESQTQREMRTQRMSTQNLMALMGTPGASNTSICQHQSMEFTPNNRKHNTQVLVKQASEGKLGTNQSQTFDARQRSSSQSRTLMQRLTTQAHVHNNSIEEEVFEDSRNSINLKQQDRSHHDLSPDPTTRLNFQDYQQHVKMMSTFDLGSTQKMQQSTTQIISSRPQFSGGGNVQNTRNNIFHRQHQQSSQNCGQSPNSHTPNAAKSKNTSYTTGGGQIEENFDTFAGTKSDIEYQTNQYASETTAAAYDSLMIQPPTTIQQIQNDGQGNQWKRR